MYQSSFIIGNEMLEGFASSWHPYILKFRNQSGIFNETVSIENSGMQFDINIFPNPASKTLFATYNFPKIIKNLSVTLYSSLGQKIITKSHSDIQNGILTFDVTNLSSGIYFLNMSIDNQIISELVVVTNKN